VIASQVPLPQEMKRRTAGRRLGARAILRRRVHGPETVRGWRPTLSTVSSHDEAERSRRRAEAERPGFGMSTPTRDTRRSKLKMSSQASVALAIPRTGREAQPLSLYTRFEWPKPKCSGCSLSRPSRCPDPECGV
jgi:hypothetical protein